jgi:sugar phosphate isomerase/epimerase
LSPLADIEREATSAAVPPAARVALMLYSVRAECSADLQATLCEVAEIGYAGVELFDLHGHSAEKVWEWLDALGLVVCGRHVSLDAIESTLPELAAEAEILGSRRVILSWIKPPVSREEGVALAQWLGQIAERAAGLGLEFGFHNHDGELQQLQGGGTFLDELLEQPVFLELDLGWAWWAGRDPVVVLDLARGRVPLVHIKDFRARDERSFCPVGDGAVDFGRVAPAAVAAGVEWLVVEQDETDGSALDDARRSFGSLATMLAAS